MGNETDPGGAGSSAAAATAGPVGQAAAAAAPPPVQPYPPSQPPGYAGTQPPGYAGAQPQGYPGAAPPPQSYGAPPPNYYAAPPPPAVVQGRPPLVSIISPDDMKKIRKMQWINFGCTMVQLLCSLAIILLVRNNLTSIRIVSTSSGSTGLDFDCFAATAGYPGTCEYAYSLASVSIFFCFILSLMQCLTMDCCGMGRAVEAGFDAAASAWWIAGGITLGLRAGEANAQGVPQRSSRNAVVALCWLSAVFFMALFVTNLVLIKKLGRAYKAAHQQMQQHMTAYPVQGVQMAHMGGHHAGGFAPHQPGYYGAPAPAGQQPGAYPGGAPAGYPPQQQQHWAPAPGYPTSPPNAGAAPTGQNAV